MIATLIVALVGATAGKCDLEKKAPAKGGAPTSAAAKPAPAVPPVKPGKPKGGDDNGAEPAPVQGDPSAHNQQPGEVDLYVEWTSENRSLPSCEWSKNAPGQGHPCEGLTAPQRPVPDHDYVGLWSRTETGKTGDHFEISAQGNAGVTSIDCSLMYKGAVHQGTTNGRRCSLIITLS
jgi:hypothetical protein